MSDDLSELSAMPRGSWTIDPAHSSVGFSVRHLGLTRVRGQFREFSGTVDLVEDGGAPVVEAVVDLASIDTNDDRRDGHLRSADFLDAENNPEMRFVSRAVEEKGGRGILRGELTLNGRTREVELDARFHGTGTDAYGVTRAGFSADGVISRKDFGVDFNVPLDSGGLLIGDKVAIELEIQLVPRD